MADAAHIKTEAEASPGRVGTPDEEDLYEDAGDLEFYDRNAGPNTENIYLARVPGYVWEAWVKMTEKLGDNDEVQIGTLRNWNEVKPNGLVEVRRIPCAPFG
jgi:transcription initiation factor TFIIF subunit beta